jgi:FkbM family methyltransferase
MKNTLKKILYLLSQCQIIYFFSRKIIDYARNENNCDIDTNGELHFIKKTSSKLGIVFDVGANIGEWTNLVAKVSPEAKVYSFEPSRETFKVLSKNILSSNVHIQNIGLGDQKEAKDFYIYGENSVLNSAIERHFSDEIRPLVVEKVLFNTLDDFCNENNINRISFLKVDTEGNELAVLKGATHLIKNGRIDIIQFEYGGTYIDAGILLRDVFSFFEGKPYAIYKLMQDSLKPIQAYSQEIENFQYSNYIALLKNNIDKCLKL